MMDWLIALQRWLYGGMSDGVKSAADLPGVLSLISIGFVFGLVHALMPGHGKSVLVSYHLARPSRIAEGVATGTLVALTHVGSAVVFVMAGIAVISHSFADGGRAPAFEVLSATLITVIGAFLVFRALQPSHEHRHSQDGRKLAVVTGLIPCPLTTFILTFAIAHNKLAAGFVAVAGMMAGVIATLVSFAVAAVIARERFMHALERSETLRQRFGFWLELAGAVAVLGLGLVMLFERAGRI
jgi:nickel/cobalt transporter (NicO) family protein